MDIVVTVNGRKYEASVEPRLLLSDFLRDTHRAYRDTCRLRARRLRGLHHSCQRRQRPLVPDARRQSRWCEIVTVEGLGRRISSMRSRPSFVKSTVCNAGSVRREC